MADVPSKPPQELRAGDTAQWRRSLPAYPAGDGWLLKYTLMGTAGAYNFDADIDADIDGDDYQVTVAASVTKDWAPGRYMLTEYVTKDSDRYTLATTNTKVLPDLAGGTTPTDTRTHARKVLDSIEAWLESAAPIAGAVEIAGRKIQNYPLAELIALREDRKSVV